MLSFVVDHHSLLLTDWLTLTNFFVNCPSTDTNQSRFNWHRLFNLYIEDHEKSARASIEREIYFLFRRYVSIKVEATKKLIDQAEIEKRPSPVGESSSQSVSQSRVKRLKLFRKFFFSSLLSSISLLLIYFSDNSSSIFNFLLFAGEINQKEANEEEEEIETHQLMFHLQVVVLYLLAVLPLFIHFLLLHTYRSSPTKSSL